MVKKTVEVTVEEQKELVIRLPNLSKPDFIFKGIWTGKDVKTVLRHLFQAYRRDKISQAKAMAPVQEQPVLEGVSNVRTES